ncbi:hypothetical protein FBU30_005113 [Linnemannia zychae]|nr:hypothetical protein FBU30_005113 [Linnemannia zychae]
MATNASLALDIPEILQWVLNCRQILGTEDLFSTSLVKRSWYDASKRALWNKIELDSDSWIDPYHQALAAQLSKYGHFVQTLVLKECVADRSQLEALLPFLTHLQSIVVGRVTLYNRSAALFQSLELLPMAHLQHLCLPHVSIISGRIDLLLQICESQTHQLHHLELLDSDIDDAILENIARTCPSIRTLDLSRNEVITLRGFFHSENYDSDKNIVSWSSNRSSPYSQQQGVWQKQHDTNNVADDTLGIRKQQQQYVEPMLETCQSYSRHHHIPSSKLLQEDLPFMHLEELSLVFCFGITNDDFQNLFRFFRNKSLRSLNLQFTNIEDSGLEALAYNLGYRLTSVSVSYCNKITARGIRALVQPNRCPCLLELEFLSCDLVSADCFRVPGFWGCNRLRRLEFTFHPQVAIARMERERAAAEAEERREQVGLEGQESQTNPPTEPLLDLAITNIDLVLPLQNQGQHGQVQHHHQQYVEQQQQQQQKQKQCEQKDKQTKLQNDETCSKDPQVREQEELESVRNDYYALFRQLKRLAELRYLNIYNSPALNSTYSSLSPQSTDSWPNSSDSLNHVENAHASAASAIDLPSIAISQETRSRVVDDSDESSSSDYSPIMDRQERIQGSFASEGQQESTDVLQDIESHLNVSDNQSQLSMSSKAIKLLEPSQKLSKTKLRIPEPKSIHPFSLRMGIRALGRLSKLESLTFYERSCTTLGQAEVHWICKYFPHLSKLQLRGSIDVLDETKRRLSLKRPDIQLQVCSLFE